MSGVTGEGNGDLPQPVRRHNRVLQRALLAYYAGDLDPETPVIG